MSGTRELQDILLRLEQATDEVVTALSRGELPVKDQVDAGQALWRIVGRAQRAIDPLKAALRKEAEARAGGKPGKQFFHGRSQDSRCTVVIPQPTYRLREGVTVEALQQQLGLQVFPRFFKTNVHVSVREDFPDQAAQSEGPVLQVLVSSVDPVSDPPRISFLD